MIIISVVEVKVDLDELAKKLKEAAKDIIMEAAVAAFDKALIEVPVRTGLLRSSIVLREISELEWEVSAGGGRYKEKGKPYYAPFVEFGTRKMAPRPYMRPAWEKARRTVSSRLRRLSL